MENVKLGKLNFLPLPIGKSRTNIGLELYDNATEIFPWNRSLTGFGVEKTLRWIETKISNFKKIEFKTGKEIFDWVVPEEWNISEAWLEDPDGKRIIDFKTNNLHIVNYSSPVDTTISLDELQHHLYSLPEMPDAVPYVTSYYEKNWGFCLPHSQREKLINGTYRAVIKSSLKPGVMNIGEIFIRGQTDKEVLISTYICHPSMANNEVSGIVVLTKLVQWLQSTSKLKYSYRILFCPETIGAIAFLSERYKLLKSKLIAGFVVTMVGDDRGYSFIETPNKDSLTDRVANHVVKYLCSNPNIIPHTMRASDERQFCSPGIDLPVVTVMRGGRYPEYHTSEDNLGLISPVGLYGGFEYVRLCVSALEMNCSPRWVVRGEPHLSKYDLRKTTGGPRILSENEFLISNILAFSNGQRDLLQIADLLEKPIWEIYPSIRTLKEKNLITL